MGIDIYWFIHPPPPKRPPSTRRSVHELRHLTRRFLSSTCLILWQLWTSTNRYSAMQDWRRFLKVSIMLKPCSRTSISGGGCSSSYERYYWDQPLHCTPAMSTIQISTETSQFTGYGPKVIDHDQVFFRLQSSLTSNKAFHSIHTIHVFSYPYLPFFLFFFRSL